jgi:hypothetical protein
MPFRRSSLERIGRMSRRAQSTGCPENNLWK